MFITIIIIVKMQLCVSRFFFEMSSNCEVEIFTPMVTDGFLFVPAHYEG